MRPLLFLALLASGSAHAGWYIGNGGDAIQCSRSVENDLDGIYSLDYILTLRTLKGDDELTPVKSWKESSERLMKILVNKAPTLASSFKDFAALIYNINYSQTRVWEPVPFGLVKLDDQRITSLLPENCRGSNGEFQIMQAVIRQYEGFSGTKNGHYIYKYFPEVLKRLEAQAPLQLSFLMVHEWLWDISSNVDRNRRIARFLHSKEIETMTAAEVEATLKGMGLALPEKQSDAFDSDLWQGYPVTEKMFFERFNRFTTMSPLGQLKVDRREKDAECADGDRFCNPEWRKGHTPYNLEEGRNRFFLTASWNFENQKQFPIKIVSPELILAGGRSILPGMGEIECRFVDNADPKDGNLECRFQNTDLIYPLFNLQTYELPVHKWPTMKASLTEECFRLLVRSDQSIETVGPGGQYGQIKQITETAFTLRLRWHP